MNGRHRVAVLVREGLSPMELGLVHQILGGARSPGGQPLYELITCAPVPGKISTDADFPITVEHGPEALARADTVIVPASHASDSPEHTGKLDDMLRDTLAHVRPATRLASVCTGAFVPAAAGLLDRRRATTHWNCAEEFRRFFPSVRLDPNVLYTDDGEVLTSAGEAAGIDLCLHLVRTDFGAAVANDVARRMVVPPHRDGGQAQFIRHPVPEPSSPSTVAARAWAVEHLDRALPLAELAACEAMSVRTFTRHFRDEVGMSPSQWLLQQRLERARQLLVESELPVDRVAAQAGFGTTASLRRHVRAALGVSPSTYRSTFRGVSAGPTG